MVRVDWKSSKRNKLIYEVSAQESFSLIKDGQKPSRPNEWHPIKWQNLFVKDPFPSSTQQDKLSAINGKKFNNVAVKDICKILGAYKIRNISWNSQYDGALRYWVGHHWINTLSQTTDIFTNEMRLHIWLGLPIRVYSMPVLDTALLIYHG